MVGREVRQHGKQISASTPYSAAFQQWWARYPRKVDKGHAWTAYQRAVLFVIANDGKTSHEAVGVLLSGVTRFAATQSGCDLAYCPYPATWLNGHRWEDEETDRAPFDDDTTRLNWRP